MKKIKLPSCKFYEGACPKISNEAPPVNFIAALNDGIAKLKVALAQLRAEEAE